ncbi:MAG: acyl-CoA carboxylase subunit beta [Gammaproteobacteria bacterium]|nr:MAG: acyl-CoA carboxylase subunit beta [Gammaproteobacteria bacterium]
MSALNSTMNRRGTEFNHNRGQMLDALADVRNLEACTRELGERQRQRFEAANKLLPRDRLDQLLDPGSPFIALSSLAGLGMHEDDAQEMVMGGGLLSGIGFVCGTRVIIIVSDSAIKGGTSTWAGASKILRAQEIAERQKLPMIYLLESGGGNLRLTYLTFAEMSGRRFANQARLSAAGIPQITVVHGNATAGGAYVPGMSDYVIAVKEQAKMFLAGPPLLKMATGEIADDESLGGGALHAREVGTAEWLADSDAHAIALAREVVQSLHWDSSCEQTGRSEPLPPRYPAEELAGVVPTDYRTPYDVRELIARIADDSRFLEFKTEYDPFTICGTGAIDGYPCAFIGNNGPITAKGAAKAGQFIQLCDQSQTPLIFLQNTTGFIVGRAAESEGIIKHGSKLIQAVATARVPRITLMVGASFGAGNYAMCGRGFNPDFLFSWPSHRIGVMGGEQAAGVLEIVTRAGLERKNKDPDEDKLAAQREEILALYDRTSSALYATARLWDDGIIDPRDSRRLLAECLAIVTGAKHRTTQTNSFGVGRF